MDRCRGRNAGCERPLADAVESIEAVREQANVFKITKIVSGGQTGVDQAALRAAGSSGISIGGWCPPDRVCDGGKIPDVFPLKETPTDRSPDAPDVPRSQRTEWNVRDSDATLMLWPTTLHSEDPGTRWTAECASRYQKPILTCDPGDPVQVIKAQDWLSEHEIRAPNVAGPSERSSPGVGAVSERFVLDVLKGGKNASGRLPGNGAVAGSKSDHKAEPLPWWLGMMKYAASLFGAPRLLYALAAVALALTVAAFVAVKYLNFSVIGGQVYLGGTRELGAHATVDAIAAFQTSGVQLKKGQKIRLTPDGRVSVATDHQLHLAQAVKGFIVQRTPAKRWPASVRKRYPEVALTESNVFYRDWVGPEGEDVTSDILDECKIRKDLGWGALMFVTLPQEPSARTDPYEVLAGANLTPSDLIPLPHAMTITVTREGWLAFIIDEAVLSPLSPSADSRLFYSVLKKASQELSGDVRHQIPLRSIPLIWYADNAGAFRVVAQLEQDPSEYSWALSNESLRNFWG
jgi:hypothetical protein